MTIFQKGLRVCTATHPQQPNYSGNARGRKLHLVSQTKRNEKNRPMTLCGMLVDRYRDEASVHFTVFSDTDRECVNCLREKEKGKT